MRLNERCACAYITDGGFAGQTMVSMFSLISNWNSEIGLDIYVLCFDGAGALPKIFHSVIPERVSLNFIKVKRLSGEKATNPLPKIALYKFDVPELIDHETILYLDGDTIVLEDLSGLFELNLNPHAVGAVPNYDTRNRVFSKYGCGVLLFNTEAYRRQALKSMLWRNAEKEPLGHPDDKYAFNETLGDDFFILPTKYNFSPTDSCAAEKNELAAILHYSGSKKPWNDIVPGKMIWESFRNALASEGIAIDI